MLSRMLGHSTAAAPTATPAPNQEDLIKKVKEGSDVYFTYKGKKYGAKVDGIAENGGKRGLNFSGSSAADCKGSAGCLTPDMRFIPLDDIELTKVEGGIESAVVVGEELGGGQRNPKNQINPAAPTKNQRNPEKQNQNAHKPFATHSTIQ